MGLMSMAQEQVSRKICSDAHNRFSVCQREAVQAEKEAEKEAEGGGVGWETTDLSNYSS